MGYVTITNNTLQEIIVNVTTTGEGGDDTFFPLQPATADRWNRSRVQVAFVKRRDNGKTETHVVEVGQALVIS